MGVFEFCMPNDPSSCYGSVTGGGRMLKCGPSCKLVAEELSVDAEPRGVDKYIEKLLRDASKDDKWLVSSDRKVVTSVQGRKLVHAEVTSRVAMAAGETSVAASEGYNGMAVVLQPNSVALARGSDSMAIASGALHSVAITEKQGSLAIGGNRYGLGGMAKAMGQASVAYGGHAFAENRCSVALGGAEARSGDHGVSVLLSGSVAGHASTGKSGVVLAEDDWAELSGGLGSLLCFWKHVHGPNGELLSTGWEVVHVDGVSVRPGDVVARKSPDGALHTVEPGDGSGRVWGHQVPSRAFTLAMPDTAGRTDSEEDLRGHQGADR
jgi:hypothetical protein